MYLIVYVSLMQGTIAFCSLNMVRKTLFDILCPLMDQVGVKFSELGVF